MSALDASICPDTWVQPDYRAIVLRIQNGDTTAESELVTLLSRGLRRVAFRRLGDCTDIDDAVNEVLTIALTNIRAGRLLEPERLPGYVHSIAKHVLHKVIDRRIRARSDSAGDSVVVLNLRDPGESPEQRLHRLDRKRLMLDTLKSLSERQREILHRFYLNEESPAQICEEMHLTETQFRLLKSRAKAKFAEIGQRRAVQRATPAWLRTALPHQRESVETRGAAVRATAASLIN